LAGLVGLEALAASSAIFIFDFCAWFRFGIAKGFGAPLGVDENMFDKG
jgi:hypothetical protein